MPTILVTGAASGLGAAFVDAYSRQQSCTVLAADITPIQLSPTSDLRTFTLDVSSQASVTDFARQISNESIDILIHSAGIRGLVPAVEMENADHVSACETLDVMDLETMMRTFQINTVGTFMLLRALVPNLQKVHGKAIVMSSRMGSIGNNEVPNKDAGSAYAYRASKAALNTVVRSMAVDVPEICFILCHPGRVETKLVKCVEQGAITADESVRGILALIAGWIQHDSGKYYDRFGKRIEW